MTQIFPVEVAWLGLSTQVRARGSEFHFLLLFLNQTITPEPVLKKIALIIFSVIILSACGSAPRFTSKIKREIPERTPSRYEKKLNSEVLETQQGIASFYSDQFNGKITYSGEIYNMFGLTAAHPFYQMGTIIRVTNLSNDKSVVIPINDRMPFRPDRIIDLSLGTAQELDMITDGITEVKVEVLEWGKGKK